MYRIHWKCGVLVLAAVATLGSGDLSAAPLNGIPDGNFTAFTVDAGPALDEGASVGYWTYYNSANASALVVGDGDDRHVELYQNWKPRSASLWYTNATATTPDAEIQIQADLKWGGGAGSGLGSLQSFNVFEGNNGSTLQLGMTFHTIDGTISWTTPTQSGTFSPTTPLGPEYATARFQYDPISGKATGYFAGQTVFDVITSTGLTFRTVMFQNATPTADHFSSGALWVDNVSASFVPEPAALSLMGLGGLVLLRRKS